MHFNTPNCVEFNPRQLCHSYFGHLTHEKKIILKKPIVFKKIIIKSFIIYFIHQGVTLFFTYFTYGHALVNPLPERNKILRFIGDDGPVLVSVINFKDLY